MFTLMGEDGKEASGIMWLIQEAAVVVWLIREAIVHEASIMR
jgi:hypothetical protein